MPRAECVYYHTNTVMASPFIAILFPRQIGNLATSVNALGVAVVGNYVYLADNDAGLHVPAASPLQKSELGENRNCRREGLEVSRPQHSCKARCGRPNSPPRSSFQPTAIS